MALVSSEDRFRIPIPHEPDQWVELRPLTARGIAEIQRTARESKAADVAAETTLRLIAFCVTGWSYDEPPSPEAFDRLDYETFNWLDEECMKAGRISEDEKKRSEPPSSLTSVQAPGSSRRNSVI